MFIDNRNTTENNRSVRESPASSDSFPFLNFLTPYFLTSASISSMQIENLAGR